MKKKILTVIQVAVTVLLLWYVLSQVNFSDRTYTGGSILSVEDELVKVRLADGTEKTFSIETVETVGGAPLVKGAAVKTAVQSGLLTILADIDVRLAVPFALLSCLVIFLTSTRLYLLLKVQKLDITFGQTIRYSFIGVFFNWVLPGLVTGDVVKWYLLGKKTGRVAMTGLIIALDRALGAFMLFAIASVVSIFADLESIGGADKNLMEKLLWIVWVIRLATVAGAVGCLVLFSRRLYRILRLEKLYRAIPGGRFFEKLHHALLLYRECPGTLAVAFVLCAGVHFTTITCNFGLGRALGIANVTFLQYSVFIPIVYAAVGVIPLSVGGLGLRESMYVLTLRSVQVPAEAALNLSLLFWVVCVLWSVPGAFFYMAMRDRVSTDEMQQRLDRADEEQGSPGEGES